MSTRDLRRSEVLGRVQRGELKLTEAAEWLEVSYRHAKRLKKRYGEGGAPALVHGNVGRSSNRAKPAAFRQQVLRLVREHYGGRHERRRPSPRSIWLDHGLSVARETLRGWLLAAGLWSRRRKRKAYRSRRQRRSGDLAARHGLAF